MEKCAFVVRAFMIFDVLIPALGYRCFIGKTQLSTLGQNNGVHWTLTPAHKHTWCPCTTVELQNGTQSIYSSDMLTKLKERCEYEVKTTTTTEPRPTSSKMSKLSTTTVMDTTTPDASTVLITPLPTVDHFLPPSGDCPTLQAHQSFASCRAAYESGYNTTDGVFVLSLSTGLIRANCDMKNGGWMLIQRRLDGSQLFNLTFSEYGTGFGNLCGEFYWGNDNLKSLMGGDKYNL
ncbi:uncharacterized protein [Amphiura filiformis]|uniref:uncharacterized protein n=1 Tax=Amphiura filiformis TaxID=82378 RepID=UPI003B227F06